MEPVDVTGSERSYNTVTDTNISDMVSFQYDKMRYKVKNIAAGEHHGEPTTSNI